MRGSLYGSAMLGPIALDGGIEVTVHLRRRHRGFR
jgi:hypothetical protein